MREIPKKNYYILVILLIVTALLTLLISNIYLTKEKVVSDFYEYSNKITPSEFGQFMTENSDVVIYISDRYDLTYEKFEKKLKNKIDELSLSNNLIFIDKKDIDKKFIKELDDAYKINISLDKLPIILVIIDNEVVKNVTIKSNTDVDSLIDNEAFK